ncbi:hemolysin family protein [Anaeromyxobacter sp. Fw109-5]|uniref:hemolysin family protein n=1 Tax=Anaeromyxobacter sp. (strain Fw109-5) TaxID=404589 RepID=UPI0000ED6DB9|nr:CNNM domain-containing protein [Anaeromyxobacter sp. Fw109-5]ABS28130.1 CBS domain containing protein [Anaeromyxobacter sp. Fw109-5]
MDPSIRHFLVLAASAAALLAVRALVAALEAALVAVGTPRAQELAADPSAGPQARALASLLAEPEITAFTLRATVTFATVFAGVLAAAAGAAIAPGSPWLAGVGIAAGAVLLSLPLAAGARGLGAAHGETVALALAPPFRLLRRIARPFAAVVGLLAGKRARFSNPPPPLDEMERALSEYARVHGVAGGGATTSELIHAVFEFRDKIARDVMVPRTEVVALDVDTPVHEILRLMAEEGHSRMPIYRGSLDHILGVLHARDLVPMLAHPELIVLRDILRPAHFVPWSKPIDQLLREMQRRQLHMALVVDEYGGVMGVCTLEDVLEQIVGDIGDEFDQAEGRSVEAHGDGSFTVLGATAIAEFNASAAAAIPEDQGVETMAGFLNSLAGAIPAKGDRFFWRGWVFTVADGDSRKVTKVRAARVKRA